MKTLRKLELARTGEWGQDGAAITRKDLNEVVETFAGRPPLAVGHIPQGQKEGPRYGQVLSVELAEKGNLLLGQVEFGDAANAAYLNGEYDSWSVSIPRRAKDGKRYLHHLALLGETPPKIPGLKELEPANFDYADGDTVETYAFQGGLKEREEARVTEDEAARLAAENKRLEEENKKLLEEKAKKEKAAAEEAKKAAEAKDAGEGGKNPAGKKDSEFSDRLAKMEHELQKSRVEAFMAKVGGKIPQGLWDEVKGLALQLACNEEPFNFSDGGKDTSVRGVDLLSDILSQWPAPVKTGASGFDYSDNGQGGGKPVDWGKVAKGM